MHNGIVEKSLVLIVKTGLYASILMPLVVTNFTLFPYVFGKAMFFQFVIEFIFPFWALLIALYPAYRPFFSKSFKSAGIINTLIGVWALALILTTVTSANTARSFWGSQERMMGVFTILHFIAMYYMLVGVFRSKREVLNFLCGVCGIGIAAVFYIHYEWLRNLGERADGTFGNPGIAGSFILFLAFLIPILFLLADAIKLVRRRYLVIVCVIFEFLTLAAILFNQTRAVWIGIFISFLIGLWFIPARLKRFKRLGYAGAGVICCGAALFAAMVFADVMPARFYAAVPFLERVRGLQDQSRIFVWKAGLRSFPDRPIFGYGPGNFSIPFNKEYDPIVATFIAAYIGPRLSFDQAHNQPLEYLTTTGIVGFAAYFALFAASLFLLWKGRDKVQNIIAFLLIIAYIAHSFFTFDTPSSFFLLMIVLWVAHHFCSATNTFYAKKNISPNSFLVLVVSVLFPTILIIFIFNVKSVLASHNAAIALAAINAKADTATKWYFLKKAVDYRSSYSFDIAEEVGDDFIDSIEEYSPELESIAPVLIEILEKQSDNEWHRLLLIGRFYMFLCQKDATYCARALTYFERAKSLAPNRFQIYSEIYIAYNNLAEYGEARDAIERAIELGYAPRALQILTNLGFLYGKLGEYKKSSLYYEQALALNQDSRDILASLVAVFAESGDISKAREYADRLFVLDPERKESVELFLKEKEQ